MSNDYANTQPRSLQQEDLIEAFREVSGVLAQGEAKGNAASLQKLADNILVAYEEAEKAQSRARVAEALARVAEARAKRFSK